MDNMMILWLVVLVVSIVIEIITLGLTSIWFAGGALVAIVATAFNAPVWLQSILFFAAAFALLYFTRPIAVKYFNKDRIKTNAESLVGKQAIVIAEINNIQGVGQVTVGGQEWSARNCEEQEVLPAGCVVEVVSISGVKLMVRKVLS